jgi:3-oxoadipate enol-lactonase
MRYFEHEGINFAYEEYGPSDAPVVVFSHGFLMDREMFRPNIDALSDDFRCVVWDQRGFGATGATQRSFSYWDSARDLISLLDHLKIASASLVGMSQGGFIAMRAALLEPDRFRALALIATRSEIDEAPVLESFEALKVEWARNGARNVASQLSSMLLGESVLAESWMNKWEGMSSDHFDHPVNALVSRDDITTRLSEIAHPSIVFHGSDDVAINPQHGKSLASRLPNCKGFVLIDKAGHTPNLTHARDVNPPLREFLLRYAR